MDWDDLEIVLRFDNEEFQEPKKQSNVTQIRQGIYIGLQASQFGDNNLKIVQGKPMILAQKWD